jgi:predicted phosphatase
MILKDASGAKLAEFTLDAVKVSNICGPCLVITEDKTTGDKKSIKTVYRRLSALTGYKIVTDGGKVITLTGSKATDIQTLREAGIVAGATSEALPVEAVEAFKAADTKEADKINIVVVIESVEAEPATQEVTVEVKFERGGAVPKIKNVAAIVAKDPAFVAKLSADTGYTFKGFVEDLETGKILGGNVKLPEDKKLYCVWEAVVPQVEVPFFENPANFEASPEVYHSDVTYYRLSDGVFVADPNPIAGNGIQYYTIKPGVTVPENN